ncbi:TIGR02710 family CRISPR-associated protein [Gammaproteobacteria bacterium]
MTDVQHANALLISVGGSPNPVAFSIDHHRPRKVIFFVSQDSRSEIETKVRRLTTHAWADQEIITTPDHQNLMTCLEVLGEELPRKLELLRLTSSDLIVDYTGGTKTMSAALALATINDPVQYSYVGGKVNTREVDAREVRSKDGLGIVLDGSEALVMTPNPWDVLAVDLRRRLARQFNTGHFSEAYETAREAASKVSERWRGFYTPIADLCEAYRAWSGFEYSKAQRLLHQSSNKLKIYINAAQLIAFDPFMESVMADLERMGKLAPAFQALQGKDKADLDAEGMRALIIDLVANAVRANQLAGRADDGVERLYSAIEKIAKAELARLGIDNSAARPEQIPEPLRDEYVRRYTDTEHDGKHGGVLLHFGLFASYSLLSALGEPVGERYRTHEAELRNLLGERNASLMVHGWKPIRSETFNSMLATTLNFLDLAKDDLPKLPVFPST